MTDVAGRIRSGGSGLFFHRTRFLSELDLRVGGKRPRLASVTRLGTDRLLAYYLAPLPEGAAGGPKGPHGETGDVVSKGIEIQVLAQLADRLVLDVRVSNHGLIGCSAPLSWSVDADFLDQAKLRTRRRSGAPEVSRRWDDGSVLTLAWDHPKLEHSTRIRFSGAAAFRQQDRSIHCDLAVAAQGETTVRIEATPLFFGRRPRSVTDARRRWRLGCSRFDTPDVLAQTVWNRAAADLGSLILGDGEGEEQFTPAAGAPNYIALFGRDTLMTGLQAALLNPAMLRGALGRVGSWTATSYDPRFDAQPGKILHQRQLSPSALLGKTPFAHYYGDYTASGLYLLGVASAFAQSGDRTFLRSCTDRVLQVLGWLDRDADLDGDGFYEYRTLAGAAGLKNQGWKDSTDAILYPDGGMVENPIALCEVQALYCAAKRAIGATFRCLGDAALADRLAGEAQALQHKLREAFWMEDERFLALALDPEKRQVRTIASNPGDCLAYGALAPRDAAAVAERLMQRDMFSGWGVRTLSARHPAYNPLAYHLGSVWPSPNALLARGLKRYGLVGPLHRLARGLFDATRLFDMHRMPELFGGHPRDAAHPHPGLYPEACSPQAWSAGAMISIIATLVGFRPAAPLGALVLEPDLPPWLPEVTLRDVQAGAGRISFRIERGAHGQSQVEVLEDSTGLRVLHGAAWREEAPEIAAFADAMF